MSFVLQDWVREAAERDPHHRAVVDGDTSIDYEELELRSDRLARALAESGCRPGDRVAVLLPKSASAVVSIVGILKAGAAYVPLDDRSPGARLARVVERCDPSFLIASAKTATRIAEMGAEGAIGERLGIGWLGTDQEWMALAEDGEGPWSPSGSVSPTFTATDLDSAPTGAPARSGSSHDPAYIFFTSGSTGTPKGVVITHDNVRAFVEWSVGYFELGPSDRLSNHAPLTFDLSTFDLYASFAAGAELHLVPEGLNLLPHRMADFMRDSELTHWLSVPSLFDYMARFGALGEHDLPAMRNMTWCGDVLPMPALRYWMEKVPGAEFTNLYGPTETTVASSHHTVRRPLHPEMESVPIGRGCGGDELLLLDENHRPVPTGITGDIYIRGPGVSPGYWNDPERTQEAFVPDPESDDDDARIYFTGDLGRRDDDGLIHFRGRADQQVKARGYRVELGEIESALLSLEEVDACAVVGLRTGGFEGVRIACAYIPAADGGSGPQEPPSGGNGATAPDRAGTVKEKLSRLLPEYMLPSRWLAVERLPLNDRGKVDRRQIRSLWEEAR